MPYSTLITTSLPIMAGKLPPAASIDVPADELADFHERCASAGLDAASFGITATERLPDDRLSADRHVHVSRGAVSVSYDASRGMPWVEPVVRDMSAGLFGEEAGR
jgi:hypothetical protein